MILSPYVRAYPHPEKSGTVVVFSARKGSVCLLPEALFQSLQRGEVPERAVPTLTKLGVLTADPESERAETLGMLARMNQMSLGLNAAVILGMECNFRCGYCYEGTLKGKKALEPATADRLVTFLDEHLRPGMKDVILDFYGGEPLLYLERIVQISEATQALAEARSVQYSFTLVTNGSLLTPEVVTRLLPLGLMGVKVTLDGPAPIHNRSRPFASGRGTFATIIKNLQACCDLIPIGIGGTYSQDKYSEFPKLLDDLLGAGLGPDKIPRVSFGPVMRVSGAHAPPEACSGCATLDEPWIVQASSLLREEILRRGYAVNRIAPAPCMVDRRDAFTVNWDGTLSKCPGLIGNGDLVVGDIWDGFGEYRETYALDRLDSAPECATCEYLPLCFGGCRFMRFQREGHMRGVECQKAFLDATLETHLLQDVRYRLGSSA